VLLTRSFPITAAGQSRTCTGFPLATPGTQANRRSAEHCMSAVGVLSRTRTDWTRPKRTCECTLAPTRFRHSGSTEGPDVFGTPRSESLALGLPLAREFTRQTSDSPLTVGGRRLTGAPSKPRVAGSSPAGRAIAYPRGFAPRTPLHGRSRGPPCPAPLPWLTRLRSFALQGLRPSDSPTRSRLR
jgi:hypothetical protein